MYMMGIEGAGKVEEVEGASNGQLKEDYRVYDGEHMCVCVGGGGSVCLCV